MRLYNATLCTPMGIGHQSTSSRVKSFLPTARNSFLDDPFARNGTDRRKHRLCQSKTQHQKIATVLSTDSTEMTDPISPEHDSGKEIEDEDVFETLPAMRELDRVLQEALGIAEGVVTRDDGCSLATMSLMLNSQSEGHLDVFHPGGVTISSPSVHSHDFDVDKEIEWAKNLSGEIDQAKEPIHPENKAPPESQSNKACVQKLRDSTSVEAGQNLYTNVRASLRRTKTALVGSEFQGKIPSRNVLPPIVAVPTVPNMSSVSPIPKRANEIEREPEIFKDEQGIETRGFETVFRRTLRRSPRSPFSAFSKCSPNVEQSLMIPRLPSVVSQLEVQAPKCSEAPTTSWDYLSNSVPPVVTLHFDESNPGCNESTLTITPSLQKARCDDEHLTKYAKMLKMGIPLGAVKNAMQRDGVDPTLLDPNDKGSRPIRLNPAARDKFRRFRLHWDTHTQARSNTVWAMVKRDADVANLRVDENEFVALFRGDPLSGKSNPKTNRAVDESAVKVIDPKRANNGGIILARIRLSYREIARAINTFDHDAMTQEQIKGLLNFVPTTQEKRDLHEYLTYEHGTFDNLCECEKFMVAISKVRHAKRKLDAILFMQNFTSCLEELRQDARLVQKACEEISSSSRLRKVFGIVLHVGNRLNTAGVGNRRSAAEAFTVQSLSKLSQAKAFDKKTTFLQYLTTLLKRNNSFLLLFKEDLPSVFKAEKVQWDQLVTEMEKLEKDLDEVRKIALYTASNPMDDTQTLKSTSMSVAREVEILQDSSVGRFTLDACLRMGSLVKEVSKARECYNDLLCYFGEDGTNEMAPDQFFGHLCGFCRDFESALEEMIAREKAKLKETRAMSRIRPLVASSLDSEPLYRYAHKKRSPNGEGCGIFREIKNVSKGFPWRKRMGHV